MAYHAPTGNSIDRVLFDTTIQSTIDERLFYPYVLS